ncbi:hypothetical protein AOLI_G00115790 [Acnodon oligacanthus]
MLSRSDRRSVLQNTETRPSVRQAEHHSPHKSTVSDHKMTKINAFPSQCPQHALCSPQSCGFFWQGCESGAAP